MKVFLSRTLVLFYVAAFGVTASLYLLLTVVPGYAMRSGGEVGAGLATGVLMLATVVAELAAARLIARFGYRAVFAAGALLLGLPSLALSTSDGMAMILGVSAVRGLGFGLAVVVGAALIATLLPPERRGEGLGVYGVVVGVPSVIGLPLGVWLAGHAGYPAVFVLGALTALSGLIVLSLPLPRTRLANRRSSEAKPADCQANPGRAGWRDGALIRPALVFSTTAMACGIVVTFLPAVSGMVEVALSVQAGAATVARWWAGRLGDRRGASRQLIPGVLMSAAGVAALVFAPSPVAVVAGMVLFGAGFGVTQNASLATMYERAENAEYGTVSAMWNFAYDAALGAGAAGFGVLAVRTGYPAGFAITAAVMLLITVAALAFRTGSRIGTGAKSRPLSPARQS